jgi:cytochrome b561
MKYDRLTRWLHAGVALGIILQLVLSLVMEAPEPGEPAGGIAGTLFHVHATLGLAVFGLLALHWLWQLSGHTADGMGHLFPWFSAPRRAAVGRDMGQLVASRLTRIPEAEALAGSVHGLGLLTATAMGVTGTILYFGMGADGSTSPVIHAVKESHGFLATFMWLYLGGHGAMAALHQWSGRRTLSEMFDLRR